MTKLAAKVSVHSKEAHPGGWPGPNLVPSCLSADRRLIGLLSVAQNNVNLDRIYAKTERHGTLARQLLDSRNKLRGRNLKAERLAETYDELKEQQEAEMNEI